MKEEFSNLDSHAKLNLIEVHELLNDQLYNYYLLPFSTSENFQYSLEHIEQPELEFIVKYNRKKEAMYIISTVDGVRCRLDITKTILNYHLVDISLQTFTDYIVSLEFKKSPNKLSRHKEVLSGKLNLDELDNSPESKNLLNVLLNMRYVASKSSNIYKQLKNL